MTFRYIIADEKVWTAVKPMFPNTWAKIVCRNQSGPMYIPPIYCPLHEICRVTVRHPVTITLLAGLLAIPCFKDLNFRLGRTWGIYGVELSGDGRISDSPLHQTSVPLLHVDQFFGISFRSDDSHREFDLVSVADTLNRIVRSVLPSTTPAEGPEIWTERRIPRDLDWQPDMPVHHWALCLTGGNRRQGSFQCILLAVGISRLRSSVFCIARGANSHAAASP
jgi:hypothetical protein